MNDEERRKKKLGIIIKLFVREISLVNRGANRRGFLLYKSDSPIVEEKIMETDDLEIEVASPEAPPADTPEEQAKKKKAEEEEQAKKKKADEEEQAKKKKADEDEDEDEDENKLGLPAEAIQAIKPFVDSLKKLVGHSSLSPEATQIVKQVLSLLGKLVGDSSSDEGEKENESTLSPEAVRILKQVISLLGKLMSDPSGDSEEEPKEDEEIDHDQDVSGSDQDELPKEAREKLAIVNSMMESGEYYANEITAKIDELLGELSGQTQQ